MCATARLGILLTKLCNFQCSYCFSKCNNHLGKEELAIEKFELIIKQLKARGVKYVILSGGEPLLYRNIYQVIEKLIYNSFEISLCTNAYYASDEVCKKLHKLGLRKVTISLDAIDKESFEDITNRSNTYDFVIKGISNFVNNDFMVTINTVVNNTDFKYFEKIISFSEQLGVTEVCFTIPVCKPVNINRISKEKIGTIYKYLKQLDEKTKLKIEFNNPRCEIDDCPSNNYILGVGVGGNIGECLVKSYMSIGVENG